MQTPRLRIAFAGTPEFAVASLAALLDVDQHDVIAIYTQPDRPAGRGRQLRKSAVKLHAESRNLPVYQPFSFSDPETLASFAAMAPDLLIVVAYGQILSQQVLEIPRLGSLNVHASLLPRWRGAAPIQRAIEAGDRVTGVTIMQVVEALDSGPMYRTASCPITSHDTAQTLQEKLAISGAHALIQTLNDIAADRAKLERQDESLVTYADKISKTEARINWEAPADVIHRKIRAFNPVPIAHANLFGKEIRIWSADLTNFHTTAVPGTILNLSRDGLDIATGKGVLRITSLQLPGKRRISITDFVNGNPQLVADLIKSQPQ